MSDFIPLIRADVLAPALRWMINHGRDVDSALRTVDLDWYPWDDPHATIPVKNGAHFFFNLGDREGPDIAFRIFAKTGVLDVGVLGHAIAHCPTPRSALTLVSSMMPYQCTHEIFHVSKRSNACVITDKWAVSFKDQETRHLVQQYVLAVIDVICRSTGKHLPRLQAVRMVPHPEYGLSHLHPWLGCPIEANLEATLEVVIPSNVADYPFLEGTFEAAHSVAFPTVLPLRGDGTLARCVALLARGMMKNSALSLDKMAATAGISRRTLQRRLAQEGVTFLKIVEMVRQDHARQALNDPRLRLQELSEHLGYAHQSTLTRAMRRWTGKAPSTMREDAKF